MSTNIPKEHHLQRVGDWLPDDHRIHDDWLKEFDRKVEQDATDPQDWKPSIKKFQQLIESDAQISELANKMFEEVPHKAPYEDDPTGKKQIRDYKHMLGLMDYVLTFAPHWSDSNNRVGFVATPIAAVVDWPMGTPSGYKFFKNEKVNQALKEVLDEWGKFLMSEKSVEVLGSEDWCWLGKHGKKALEDVANVKEGNKSFEEIFICDPKAKNHGFKCWDDFFTRHFQEGLRPIAEPDNDNVVANACESKPYKVARNVELEDKFWLKGQTYSLNEMFDHDPAAERFVGGTVYQAFLSALSYHRWHSPITGTIKKTKLIPGTYYSEPVSQESSNAQVMTIDKGGENTGQAYLSASATRAVIFIEADNPKIGLLAFFGIGMVEVSTCDIRVKEGDKVKKGDELGMFHFGGSTHCVVFNKDVKIDGFPEIGKSTNVKVRSELARVQ